MENFYVTPHPSWTKIEPEEYIANGVSLAPEVTLVGAYKIGELYGSTNTMTVYDYGDAEDFFDSLKEFYDELQLDIDAQNQNGIFPMHYEFFGDNKMLSVTKLVNNPVVAIVDLFFQVDNKVYGYHTYLPNDEKQVELNDLCQNYPNIRYVVDEINKF